MNIMKKHIKIIKWFLNNVPTIALFASDDGNTRLNILDIETCDSVYFDGNMKKLIISKMLSIYKSHNISRFSTIVWSGYRYLALEQNRNSILFVKRGKMSSIGQTEMIFPLTGKHLQELLDNTKVLNRIQEITYLYNKFIYVIITYLDKNDYADKQALFNRFWNTIEEFIKHADKDNYNDIVLIEREKFSDDECKNYIDGIESNANVGIEFQELRNKMDEIIGTSLKKMLNLKEDLNIEMAEKKLITDGEAYKNMIQYVIENTKMKVGKAQIETLYDYFVNEVLITIKEMRYDILKRNLTEMPKQVFLKFKFKSL